MKINDIMIGDWVNFLIGVEGGDTEYDGETAYYQPLQITTIAAWGAGNDGEVASDEGIVNDPDQLRAIPLTAEILEKNGFWYEHNVGYVIEENENEIIYSLWDHKLRILENREQILNLEYLGDEMCVHELQHALRLCGIKKNIEL